MAGAVYRAFWRLCGVRGRRLGHRLGRGWLSCGRQYTEPVGGAAAYVAAAWAAAGFRMANNTHSLLEELLRAWPPLGPHLAFVWQAQCTKFPGGAAAHVAAGWAAAAPLGRGWLSCGRRIAQSLLEELRRAWPPLGPRLAFVWQAYCTEFSGGTAARVAAAPAAPGFHAASAIYNASLPTPRCDTSYFITHHLSHHFVTHYLSHTILSHTIFHTHNFVTPSLSHTTFTHYLSHTTVSHTIFDTPSFTHHLSHTIFVIPLCHTPSSHIIFLTTLSHAIFHTPSLTHHLLRTIFHTPSLTHHLYTPSLSHHIVTHHLSHIILHTTLSHTICHTPFFTHHL